MSNQLQMYWPEGQTISRSDKHELPEDYRVRTYQSKDNEKYISLMISTEFDWEQSTLDNVLSNTTTDNIIFVEHVASKQIVATAMACLDESEHFPDGTQLGWVACDKKHRGLNLGSIVCANVLQRCINLKYKNIYLKTDDFRLAAIKTYLNLGFEPLFHLSDMKERWNTVFASLNMNQTARKELA
ncbi:MAG: hypothetical protein COA79_17865 [Planctomycetota bacterium]|nr:MAG: hypothetical protein COA79_17865 [Planctomycetota bacterium]